MAFPNQNKNKQRKKKKQLYSCIRYPCRLDAVAGFGPFFIRLFVLFMIFTLSNYFKYTLLPMWLQCMCEYLCVIWINPLQLYSTQIQNRENKKSEISNIGVKCYVYCFPLHIKWMVYLLPFFWRFISIWFSFFPVTNSQMIR